MKQLKALRVAFSINLTNIISIVVYSLLLLALYLPTLKNMVKRWESDDFSYGYLIPLVIAYLLWQKKETLKNITFSPSWLGLIPFGIGMLLYIAGELAAEYFTLYVSFCLTVIGILWMNFGGTLVKELVFVWFLMFTMFPFPHFIYSKISLKLQLISSQIGVFLLWVYGMSAYREGNVIDLGFTQLQVVDACSGLRYLLSLFVLSILIAYFYRASIWKRSLLVFSSIPIAILMNSARISITGILYEKFGASVAEGFFHGFSGWLIFITALGVMLSEIWVMNKIGPKETDAREAEKEKGRNSMDQEDSDCGPSQRTFSPKRPQFALSVVFLAGMLGIFSFVEVRDVIPPRKSFSEFPLAINGWSGTPEAIEDRFLRILKLDDYIHADYKDPKGRVVNFYVAYYANQKKGKVIHSPEICLAGGGWEFKEHRIVNVQIGNHRLPLNRAVIVNPQGKEVVYFYFVQRGRVLTSNYRVKLYNFIDGITKGRTDGALVRLITPVYGGETVESAEARLVEFLKKVTPILEEFLPA